MRQIFRTTALAVSAVAIAACSDTPLPTAHTTSTPSASASSATVTPSAQGADPSRAAGAVYCDVADITATGAYRVHTITVSMPRGAFATNDETVQFGAQGATDSYGDPTQLVRCVIPKTALAASRMQKLFVERPAAEKRVPLPEIFHGLAAHPSRVRNTDPSAVIVIGQMVVDCIVDSPDCSCPDGCYSPPAEPTPGPAPTEPDTPTLDVSAPAATATCYGQTDRPHASGTLGYFHRTNVHSRTVCTGNLAVTVGVRLERSKCFFFFCWWGTVDAGFETGIMKAEAVANEDCREGWYIAYGYHTAIWPDLSAGGTQTASSNYVVCN